MNASELQQQVYDLQDERDDLQSEVVRLEEQLQQLRQQLQTARKQEGELREKFHQTSSRKDDLLGEVDDLQTRLEDQQQETHRAEWEREELREQLEDQRDRAEELLDELDSTQDKLVVLQHDTEQMLEGLLNGQGKELDDGVLLNIYRTYVVGQGLLSGQGVVLHPAATEEVWMRMLQFSRKHCEKWLRQNRRALKNEQVLAELARSSDPATLSWVGKEATGAILQKAILRLVGLDKPEAAADLIEHREAEVVAQALQEEASRLLSHKNRRLRRQAMLALQERQAPGGADTEQRQAEPADTPSPTR